MFMPLAKKYISQRQYNASLKVDPTHSYGKGLSVPFQERVVIFSTIQAPQIAMNANKMTVGRYLQDFEIALKPFTPIQTLSDFLCADSIGHIYTQMTRLP
jgi:hypothetical protein